MDYLNWSWRGFLWKRNLNDIHQLWMMMYGCVVIWVNRRLTWAFFLSKASQLRLRHSTHINITWFMSHGESKFLALPKWVQLIHWEAWRLWCFSKRLDLWWYVGVWNPLWILTCMLLVETANITWLQRQALTRILVKERSSNPFGQFKWNWTWHCIHFDLDSFPTKTQNQNRSL